MILRQLAADGRLPLLAHYFHIQAWDIPRLSMTQLNAYLAALPPTKEDRGQLT